MKINLSHIIFVLSYNDSSKIDPALRDFIHEIKIDDPSIDDKTVIGHQYLFNEIANELGLKVTVKPEVIRHILKNYCSYQPGIRGLKSCIQTLLLRINTAQYMKTTKYKCLEDGVVFPLEVTQEMADELLADMKVKEDDINMMYS